MSLTLNDIPQWWRDLLAQIQTTAPEAIIAGGALRDLYIGPDPKDLDIFIGDGSDYYVPELNLDVDAPQSAALDDTLCTQHVFTGFDLPVNIIEVSRNITPYARFEQFDFGICKIAFDGKQVITHPEFLWDLKSACFTLRRADSPDGIIYSLQRYNRLKQKYKWPLIIPSTLELKANHDL